jgi:hypothetical protein
MSLWFLHGNIPSFFVLVVRTQCVNYSRILPSLVLLTKSTGTFKEIITPDILTTGVAGPG